MDVIRKQGGGTTPPSFEIFQQKMERAVDTIISNEAQIRFQGLWHAASTNEALTKSVIKPYNAGMQAIYEMAIKGGPIEVLDEFKNAHDLVKQKIFLTLLCAFSEGITWFITDFNISTMIEFALHNDISIGDSKGIAKYSSWVIPWTRRLIRIEETNNSQIKLQTQLRTILGDRGRLHYTTEVNNHKFVDLAKKQKEFQRVLRAYFMSVDDPWKDFNPSLKTLLPSMEDRVALAKFCIRAAPYKDIAGFELDEADLIDIAKIVTSLYSSAQALHLLASCNVNKRKIEIFARELINSNIPIDIERWGWGNEAALQDFPKDLLEIVARAGNDEALSLLGDKFEQQNAANLIYVYPTLFKFLTLEQKLKVRGELLAKGDSQIWNLPEEEGGATEAERNDKSLVLQAFAHNPFMLSEVSFDLRIDPDILDVVLAAANQGKRGAVDLLPPELRTTENVLLSALSFQEAGFSQVTNEWIPRLIPNQDFTIAVENIARRTGKEGCYHYLTPEQRANRALMLEAIKNNPIFYEQLRYNPLSSDPELIRIYLTAFPWKVEAILIILNQPKWMMAAIHFAQILLQTDGYLQLTAGANAATQRFVEIARKLPMDLQIILAARQAESGRSLVHAKDVEWALRYVLLLQEHGKRSAANV